MEVSESGGSEEEEEYEEEEGSIMASGHESEGA